MNNTTYLTALKTRAMIRINMDQEEDFLKRLFLFREEDSTEYERKKIENGQVLISANLPFNMKESFQDRFDSYGDITFAEEISLAFLLSNGSEHQRLFEKNHAYLCTRNKLSKSISYKVILNKNTRQLNAFISIPESLLKDFLNNMERQFNKANLSFSFNLSGYDNSQ